MLLKGDFCRRDIPLDSQVLHMGADFCKSLVIKLLFSQSSVGYSVDCSEI